MLLSPEQQKHILTKHRFRYPLALAMHFSSGLWSLWDYSGKHKVGKYCFSHKMQPPFSDDNQLLPNAYGQPRNIQTAAGLGLLM